MIRNRRQRSIRSVRDLCSALRYSTSLHSFVCQGVGAFSDEYCTRLALEAMRCRPNLKRILADFPSTTQLEQELKDLMESKKTRWMQDWNAVDATPESRVHLLEELRNCQQVDEQDIVAALFHFLRSNPGALPETVGNHDGDRLPKYIIDGTVSDVGETDHGSSTRKRKVA